MRKLKTLKEFKKYKKAAEFIIMTYVENSYEILKKIDKKVEEDLK